MKTEKLFFNEPILHKKYIPIYISYIVCVFFSVFDGVRGVQFPSYFPFSLMRDTSLFTLFILSLGFYKNIKFDKEFSIIFISQIFILFYTLFTSVLVSNHSVYVRSNNVVLYQEYGAGVGVWMKMLTFIMLTYSTYCIAKVIKVSFLYKTMKWFVIAAFLYSIITIIIYTVFPQIAIKLSHWGGRLSLGYPTEDVCFLALSLVFIYYINMPSIYKIIIVLSNTLALFFQNTLTGFLLFAFVLFFYFLKGGVRLKFIVIVILVCIFVGAGVVYNNSEKFSDFGMLLHNKIDSILYFSSSENDPSFYLRMQQKELMLKSIFSDPIFFLFGYGGIGGMAVESGLYSILGFAGTAGVIIYGVTLFYYIMRALVLKDMLLFCLVSMYCISSVSIAPLYLMTTYWLFSFIIVYSSVYILKEQESNQ